MNYLFITLRRIAQNYLDNFLFNYANQKSPDKIGKIIEYTQTFENDIMSED